MSTRNTRDGGYAPYWIINCSIEEDFWLQVITEWDRGDYWNLDPQTAYYTMDDSLIVNLPVKQSPPPTYPTHDGYQLRPHLHVIDGGK